jgi:hypothetical protein
MNNKQFLMKTQSIIDNGQQLKLPNTGPGYVDIGGGSFKGGNN